MALYTRAFITTCPSELLDALNNDNAITPTCNQIINTGDGNSTFEFAVALSTDEEIYFDSVLSVWVCSSVNTPVEGEIDDDGSPAPTTVWSSEKVMNELTGVLGMSHQLPFTENGSAKNEWLEIYGYYVYSNQTPGVMPFRSKLVAITMSNRKDDADMDLRFYSAPEGGGATPKTLDFVWQLRNVRTARKTNFTTDIIYDAGEKIGVYICDVGKEPKNINVVMYFVAIDDTQEESSENYSGHFATGTGGGSS